METKGTYQHKAHVFPCGRNQSPLSWSTHSTSSAASMKLHGRLTCTLPKSQSSPSSRSVGWSRLLYRTNTDLRHCSKPTFENPTERVKQVTQILQTVKFSMLHLGALYLPVTEHNVQPNIKISKIMYMLGNETKLYTLKGTRIYFSTPKNLS